MAILYNHFALTRTVFCVLLACFLLSAVPAEAVSDLFIINDVKVDVTAENAMSARDKAFAQAQHQAFDLLARRMLSEYELDSFTAPETATISTLIQDYEITEEKLSDVRYIGTYTFRFKDKAVRSYFTGSGVQYTDVSSKPVMVLPFYQHGGQTVLWSPYNDWMRAWNRAENLGGLVPVVVPIGDLQDVEDIGDDQALSYNKRGLSNMLGRYGAGEAVLVIASPDAALAAVRTEQDQAVGSMSVDIFRTDRAGPELVQKFQVPAMGTETKASLLDSAVRKVHATFQKDWKKKTLVSATQSNRLQVRVNFSSLQEWADTQKSLERVYGINEIVLKSLSPQSARVDLVFQGSESRLRLALEQADMTLAMPHISAQSFGAGQDVGMPLVYELYLNRYAPSYRQRF